MKAPTAILSLLAALAASPVIAQTTVNSDPVGFASLTLAGNSDSYVYLPFKRTPEFVGSAVSLAANNTYDLGESFTDTNSSGARDAGEPFTDSNNVVNVKGANFAANQFAYAQGAQPKFYMFVKTGTRTGVFYTIVSNGTSSVVVDLNGDSLAGAIDSTTGLQVIPYDTLGTIFPNGQGVNPSSTHSIGNRQTEVLFPDISTAGKDLAFPVSYYYFSGTSGAGMGWRKAGASGVLANDTVLSPEAIFVVRHNVAVDTTLTFVGTVQMATLTTPLVTLSPGIDQDNSVALPFATPMTLSQLKLFESGAFVGSDSHSIGQRKDQLLVWDNSVTGKNKAADVSYYYFTGNTGVGPGWRKAGASGVLANDDVVVSSTKGFVIRKKGTANPVIVNWTVKPHYVPSP